MTTNLPAERKPQLVAGAPVAALVPQNLEEAYRLAGALSASGMAPRGMDKPEQVMVAIMAGAELGLAPFQALQSFAVVNGRPTLWGDGLIAVVRANGVKVKEWLDGEDDGMVAHCVATRPDTGEEIARDYSVADARKAGLWGKTGPWQQHPKRMLQMRARAFALRDGCADMLRGVQIREEVEDYDHVRTVSGPKPSGLRDRLTGPTTDEGFTAANAPAEPVAFAEQAEEIADAEFTDGAAEPETQPDADDFPGDRKPAPVDPGGWDHMAWAQGTRDQADEIDNQADLQTWWNTIADQGEEYARLLAIDEGEALAVRAYVVKRGAKLAARR